MKPVIFRLHFLVQALILAVGLCFIVPAFGQDIHLSHIHASPLYLNPAMTGVFNGDLRFIANYRGQWNSFTQGFRSLITSADMKLNRGLTIRDDMGVGFQATADRAGDLDFTILNANTSFSYLKALNSDGTHILAAGFSVGFTQNSIDITKAILTEEQDPYLQNPDFESSLSIFDLSAGLSWFVPLTVDDFLYLGGSYFHFNRSRVSFLRAQVSPIEDSQLYFPKTVLHGGGSFRLTPYLTIKPSFIFLEQGPHQEINIGTYFTINTTERRYLAPNYKLHIGGWFRWSFRDGVYNRDALVASVRYDYYDTVYAISYDINVSDLVKATNGRGGPELSIIHYIDFIRPERKQFKVKCPAF